MMKQESGLPPEDFLKGYAATITDILEKMKDYRIPAEGDRAMYGKEGMAVFPDRKENYKG